MRILKKNKSDLIRELYVEIAKMENIILDDHKMKRDLLAVFQENNYNNKDLMIRKIKSIIDKYMDPEREVNNAN